MVLNVYVYSAMLALGIFLKGLVSKASLLEV